MPSIKHLRPQSTIMISEAGMNRKNAVIATGESNDVMLGLTVSFSDGSGEELLGIQLSDLQLERLKQDIILYQESQNKSRQSDPQKNPNSSERRPSPFIYSGLPQTNQKSNQQISFSPSVFADSIVELDPRLIVVKHLGDFVEASVPFTVLGSNREKLAVISRTEKEAKMELNKKYQELVYSVAVKPR